MASRGCSLPAAMAATAWVSGISTPLRAARDKMAEEASRTAGPGALPATIRRRLCSRGGRGGWPPPPGAHPGQAGEGAVLGAQGGAQAAGLGQAPGDDHAAHPHPEGQGVGHAHGHRQGADHRARKLHPQQIVAGIDPADGRMQGLLGHQADLVIGAGRHQGAGPPRHHLGGQGGARQGAHPQGGALFQHHLAQEAPGAGLEAAGGDDHPVLWAGPHLLDHLAHRGGRHGNQQQVALAGQGAQVGRTRKASGGLAPVAHPGLVTGLGDQGGEGPPPISTSDNSDLHGAARFPRFRRQGPTGRPLRSQSR